jgi:hypothetical protein
MKNLKNGQFVWFDAGLYSGRGWVRGIASVAQPVIGRSVIVEVDSLWDPYEQTTITPEWDCITVFEVHIEA